MSIGDHLTSATALLQPAATGVAIAAFAVFWLLVFWPRLPGRRPPWLGMFMAAIVTAVAFALAFDLAPILRSTPPFRFN
ncbi:MAG: hypothetical protein OXD40_02060 [bacterium]|nr:hypothetical protein [bacterium]